MKHEGEKNTMRDSRENTKVPNVDGTDMILFQLKESTPLMFQNASQRICNNITSPQ